MNDPEIHRPITDLGMVKSIGIAPGGAVDVGVYLTVSGCPLRETITANVTEAVQQVPGVSSVSVELDVMSDEQRRELAASLRGGTAEREVPFAQPGSLTRVYCVASGKGGVGKSSVTVNLAAALAADGMKVGVVDADIYGHSVPRMLGADGRPTQVEDMIMPPSAHGVKVISIGMFTPGNAPVVWRGPMLHRALQQFLADVYWGDLDVLLLDLPPGTGDIAISVAQLVPNAEILVVTTPQQAAAEVAERAGSIAVQTHQKIVGVIENMSGMPCPHCDEMVDVFGTGGGRKVAEGLTRTTRRRGAGARRHPDRSAVARRRRRGQAGGAQRPGLPRREGTAHRRRQAQLAPARPVGHVPGPHPEQQVLRPSGARTAPRDPRAVSTGRGPVRAPARPGAQPRSYSVMSFTTAKPSP